MQTQLTKHDRNHFSLWHPQGSVPTAALLSVENHKPPKEKAVKRLGAKPNLLHNQRLYRPNGTGRVGGQLERLCSMLTVTSIIATTSLSEKAVQRLGAKPSLYTTKDCTDHISHASA